MAHLNSYQTDRNQTNTKHSVMYLVCFGVRDSCRSEPEDWCHCWLETVFPARLMLVNPIVETLSGLSGWLLMAFPLCDEMTVQRFPDFQLSWFLWRIHNYFVK